MGSLTSGALNEQKTWNEKSDSTSYESSAMTFQVMQKEGVSRWLRMRVGSKIIRRQQYSCMRWQQRGPLSSDAVHS